MLGFVSVEQKNGVRTGEAAMLMPMDPWKPGTVKEGRV